jgi:hypothetical protein
VQPRVCASFRPLLKIQDACGGMRGGHGASAPAAIGLSRKIWSFVRK